MSNLTNILLVLIHIETANIRTTIYSRNRNTRKSYLKLTAFVSNIIHLSYEVIILTIFGRSFSINLTLSCKIMNPSNLLLREFILTCQIHCKSRVTHTILQMLFCIVKIRKSRIKRNIFAFLRDSELCHNGLVLQRCNHHTISSSPCSFSVPALQLAHLIAGLK